MCCYGDVTGVMLVTVTRWPCRSDSDHCGIQTSIKSSYLPILLVVIFTTTILTIYKLDAYTFKESHNQEREASHIIVHQIKQVKTSLGERNTKE